MKHVARFAAIGLLFIPILSFSAEPAPYPKTLFEDEFSGTRLKKEWGSWKSESVVRDGVLVGITPKDADHPSVNTIKLPPLGDLEVAVSFKFAGSKRFNVMFRDLDYEGSHAGHICHVGVSANSVTLFDGKTGIFYKPFRDKRQAGQTFDGAEKEQLEKTKSTHQVELDSAAWHDLLIRIVGDTMKVWIDGELAGSLQSAGIAHPTKSNMNITTVDREVHYDHFAIRTP